MKTYILYHGGCNDGFGAAYAAWKLMGDRVHKYIPMFYAKTLELPDINSSEVICVDFCPKYEGLVELVKKGNNVVVIDHHKTTLELIESLMTEPTYGNTNFHLYIPKGDPEGAFVQFTVDMKRSGAVLTWDTLSKGGGDHHSEAPLLLRYIQDRDLWQWKLPYSKEVSAGLKIHPQEFMEWDIYANNIAPLIEEGKIALKFQDEEIKHALKQARLIKLGKHQVPVVNTQSFSSEIAHQLLKLYPDALFSACYHDQRDGTRKWELRAEGKFDVEAFAKKRGGGGHKNAAGFIEKYLIDPLGEPEEEKKDD